jgi:hypothetical protein
MEANKSEIVKPVARVLETINVPVGVAFNYIQPVPLQNIFRGYNNIPAIEKTNETEKWIRAGLSRTVTFADGNTATENMLYVNAPSYFSYKIDNFTAEGLSSLVDRVEGAWVFIGLEENKVLIDWKYIITPKNDEAAKIIQEHLLPDFQGMLEQAIRICKENLETGNV